MSVTAAEVAEKAVSWAEAAEVALTQVEEYRKQTKYAEGAREMEAARQARMMAEGFEEYRVRAVDMATMWSGVAGALQVTKAGGPA
ncbi:hypothetical protein ACFWCA_19355 [Streptomyces phaeochromogenes]|uniref:hypothetical protein n=1 Tax=Streptomyces phaeochromogenes TaxID=1923 RepID=UPI00367EC233